jgi:hypothetical protein
MTPGFLVVPMRSVHDAVHIGSFSEIGHFYALSSTIPQPVSEMSSEPYSTLVIGREVRDLFPHVCVMWSQASKITDHLSPNDFRAHSSNFCVTRLILWHKFKLHWFTILLFSLYCLFFLIVSVKYIHVNCIGRFTLFFFSTCINHNHFRSSTFHNNTYIKYSDAILR